MGRKIPGKRHRGVKDPEKQQLIRLKSIENKINSVPKNPDHQDISKSLQQFMKIKEKFKENPKRKRKTRSKSNLIVTDPSLHKKGKLYKSKDSAPAFNQKKGESESAFLTRVHETVNDVIKESKFEDKYRVKVHRNLKTGDVSNVIKRSADPLRSFIKEAKEKLTKKNKKKEPKLTKSQKKKLKLDEKKAKKQQETAYDFDIHTDKVEFGDVVHGPPTLVTPKKVNKMEGAPRPGKKDLLLKSLLNQSNESNELISKKKSVFQKIQNAGKINKKAKRKNLPHAIRRQLEKQRNEIVDAYRSLKAKKLSERL